MKHNSSLLGWHHHIMFDRLCVCACILLIRILNICCDFFPFLDIRHSTVSILLTTHICVCLPYTTVLICVSILPEYVCSCTQGILCTYPCVICACYTQWSGHTSVRRKDRNNGMLLWKYCSNLGLTNQFRKRIILS